MDHPSFSHEEMESRLTRLRSWMRECRWDACFIEDAANVRYLSGFRGEPATLWITAGEAALLTSYRSEPWASRQAHTFHVLCESQPVALAARRCGSTWRIATDPRVSHLRLQELRRAWPARDIAPVNGVDQLRRIKSPAEIECLRRSQRHNEEIFRSVLEHIRPGMSERAAQGIILQEMARCEQVERPAFAPIVAAGPNAWESHHLPDHTILKEGDMVIIDLGVMVNGYASDMTRTVCLGRATPRMREIYAKVREAQLAAMAAIADGVRAVDADAAARRVIEDAGHGRGYTHGLGHGIGVEVHDAGLRMHSGAGDLVLQQGMVVTVEPGIYLENEFGVRTEDIVVVREGEIANLTHTTHDLIEVF